MQTNNEQKISQSFSTNGDGVNLDKQVEAYIKLQEILLMHITRELTGIKLNKHNAGRVTRTAPRLPKGDGLTYSCYYLDFGTKEEKFIMEIWFTPGRQFPPTNMEVNVNAPIDVKEFVAEQIKKLMGSY